MAYRISDRMVGNVLKQHGIEPAPDRQRTQSWATFLKSHWDVLAAIDFTTVEVWTRGGLFTVYLLFAMELKARNVHFPGCTVSPNEQWVKQVARNLTDTLDGFLLEKRIVLMDCDTKFCVSFRDILSDADAEPFVLPPRSPNMNAFMERFIKSIKVEFLGRMIFFGEASLRRDVMALEHYHTERNHQGLSNQLIQADEQTGSIAGKVEWRERLGGLLKFYHRAA